MSDNKSEKVEKKPDSAEQKQLQALSDELSGKDAQKEGTHVLKGEIATKRQAFDKAGTMKQFVDAATAKGVMVNPFELVDDSKGKMVSKDAAAGDKAADTKAGAPPKDGQEGDKPAEAPREGDKAAAPKSETEKAEAKVAEDIQKAVAAKPPDLSTVIADIQAAAKTPGIDWDGYLTAVNQAMHDAGILSKGENLDKSFYLDDGKPSADAHIYIEGAQAEGVYDATGRNTNPNSDMPDLFSESRKERRASHADTLAEDIKAQINSKVFDAIDTADGTKKGDGRLTKEELEDYRKKHAGDDTYSSELDTAIQAMIDTFGKIKRASNDDTSGLGIEKGISKADIDAYAKQAEEKYEKASGREAEKPADAPKETAKDEAPKEAPKKAPTPPTDDLLDWRQQGIANPFDDRNKADVTITTKKDDTIAAFAYASLRREKGDQDYQPTKTELRLEEERIAKENNIPVDQISKPLPAGKTLRIPVGDDD